MTINFFNNIFQYNFNKILKKIDLSFALDICI